MMSKKQISSKMKAALERARAEARGRVIERGLVQFRADRELMQQLLAVADYKKTAVGPLIRSWIAPIAKEEYEAILIERVMLGKGKLLTAESDVKELQQALSDHESGRLELSRKQASAIQDWLWAGHSSSESLSEIHLADGRVLTAKSSYKELMSAYDDYKRGGLKLKAREYNALVDWAIERGQKGAEAG